MNDYLLSFFPWLIALVSLTWYVGVLVMLVKIWQKVRHLPG
jgi:hypothetical protein